MTYLLQKPVILPHYIHYDSSDITDCKLKLILGLIWTLILHYSISIPMWEGEEELTNGDKGTTPKQRLLHWIQSKVQDLPIGNFTTDWNDGKAVGALVDAVAPGLCPDWHDWDPKDSLQNATEAMGLADDWLNVRQLIKPEELVSPNMDELSMMTYLSQYPNAKLKPGAPLRQRTNPNRVRAYGPGIESHGPVVDKPSNFTVETISAGKGQVDVIVTNPKGYQEPVDIRFNNDRNLTYSVSYVPRMEGNHKVAVKYSGRDIPKSPYNVFVEGRPGDPSKVTAFGPGLNPEGNTINRTLYFDISTKDAEKGVPEVIILDPAGHKNTIPVKVRQISSDLWRCEYTANTVGMHSINIFFAGQPIPLSPFGVRLSPVSDAKKVRATGRGLQPTGVRVKDVADFKIYTDGAGEGTPEVRVIGPGGVNEPVMLQRADSCTYEAAYTPKKEGRHVVMVTFAGQEIPRSPFEVNVGPFKETKIRAYGPGLSGGVIGSPALFTVETNGETGALGFSIEGPSQAKIDCKDNGDGSADVRYFPTAPGEYAVHILCDNEDIPMSPYIANIISASDYYPEKVECSGPGVEPNGPVSGKPTHFKIDTRKAGTAPLDVQVLDGNYNIIDTSLVENRDGTYTCNYTPRRGAKHTVQVNYGGVATKNSPFRVNVNDPVNVENVRIYGPGIEKGIRSGIPTHFTVDCTEAGLGDLQVLLMNEKKMDVPLKVTETEKGIYLVEFTPSQPGTYLLTAFYTGLPVPQSPLRLQVVPRVDASKIKVEGLDRTAPINRPQQFKVATQAVGNVDLSVAIKSPSGRLVKGHMVATKEGYLVNFTPTEIGEHFVSISTINGEPLSFEPCTFTCVPGSDVSKVRAEGPGLVRGVAHSPAEFMLDTRGAGQGGLGVTVEGPCEAAINCRDNGDGTCSVAYFPTEPGDYSINITFNDQHVTGSPFQAVIVPDLSRIAISGNGIQSKGVYVDSPTDFMVDPRLIASQNDGRITCKIVGPSGSKTDNTVTSMVDGTYKVSYTPQEEGRHTVDILYDGVPVSGSPFAVNVQRGCNPKKCRAFGSGLEKGITNKPNTFTVETKGAGTGGLGLTIEGPSEAKVVCKDNRDGSCTVEYVPTEPGDYDVSIKFADQHIAGSPFSVSVQREVNPNLVRVFGPGLDPTQCRSQMPQSFTVDASKAGQANLAVKLTSDQGPLPQKPEITDNGDGTYNVNYIPPSEGSNLTARITYDNKDIPNSPFQMRVLPLVEPEKVKLSGPGVSSKGVPASVPTEFTIDTSNAGFGDLELQVVGPDGYLRKAQIAEKEDGIFNVAYTPDDCGKYKINLKYGGKELSTSPLNVQAYATGNADKCIVTEGLNRNLVPGQENCIKVNAKNAGYGAVTCRIRSTSGNELDTEVVNNGDGTHTIYYTVHDEGEYTMNLKFGGQPVPDGFYTFLVSFCWILSHIHFKPLDPSLCLIDDSTLHKRPSR
ncbi:hypothetical protein RUM44_006366 [Polyplax serrata]|uniref:Calponin-homology (CH) domain-containing protein n=1 Tax=Polyplax serrata TaxID=468196 RepID=A0ABR1AHW8_POLSC